MNRPQDPVWLVGVSMTPFGRFPSQTAYDLGATAALGALDDAGLPMSAVELLAAGSVNQARPYPGQQILRRIGQTGIPVFNVLNACATGATALRVAHQGILAGEVDIALAVGCEQMGKKGLLGGAAPPARTFEPSGPLGEVMPTEGVLGTGVMPGVFAQAGMRYLVDHPQATVEHFAKVAEKNHAHSVLNPLAQYQKRFSLEEIRAAEMIAYPNTVLMCCPTGDGAAAAVLVSDERMRSLPDATRKRAVKISASVMTSDPWVDDGQVTPDINTLTRIAAAQAYERAGVDPSDLDLVELHDCFATAELLHYENLRLCEPGGAGEFVDQRRGWRDGPTPVNVSGGLLSKGHPLGATGIANVYEVATHLRGEAGDRQVPDARVGLAHVIGLASACVIHIVERQSA